LFARKTGRRRRREKWSVFVFENWSAPVCTGPTINLSRSLDMDTEIKKEEIDFFAAEKKFRF
jgi:hypothetical protein